LAFISVFNVQMLYLPGLKNVIADFLSCPPGPLPPEPSGTVAAEAAADPIDFKAMAAEQICCAKTQRLLSISQNSAGKAGAQCLVGNISIGVFSPIVPVKFIRLFLHLHNISHPGRLAFQHLVSSRFVWRGLSNITNWARSCLHCQQGKIHHHTCLLPQPIPILQQWFAHLHIDLVGPLQYSNGCNYIFTIIDCTSREISAAVCTCALVFSWITRFRVPEMITSGRGPQFTSNV
jgi:hypothetical protein